MHKTIGFGVLCFATPQLFGCVANQPIRAPQLGEVPVGASLAKGELQEIRLLTIDESRSGKDYLWIAGKGGAKIAGGSGGFYFWNSATPPQLEIELPLNSCADLLADQIPAEQALLIVGIGRFLPVPMSGICVGKFVPDSVSSCELQTGW